MKKLVKPGANLRQADTLAREIGFWQRNGKGNDLVYGHRLSDRLVTVSRSRKDCGRHLVREINRVAERLGLLN